MNELQISADLFDRINHYYTNDQKLTAKDLEIAQRWEIAFMLLLEHRNRRTAVIKHIALSRSKKKKLSKAQAYRDMISAERIFAPLRQYTKEFLKLILLESAFRDVKEAERRAVKAETSNQWIKLMEIKNKAEYRIIQVSGINDFHPDLPDFSKIQPAQINMNISSDVMDLFKNIITKGRIDVTELLTAAKSVEDIEHSEE